MRKQHEPAYGSKIRSKWYFLAEKVGKSVTEVCRLYAISRKTYYKWHRNDHGSRTYRPKLAQPKLKLTSTLRVFIEYEKLRTNYGPKKMKLLIARRFGTSVSTNSMKVLPLGVN
jgi:transposase